MVGLVRRKTVVSNIAFLKPREKGPVVSATPFIAGIYMSTRPTGQAPDRHRTRPDTGRSTIVLSDDSKELHPSSGEIVSGVC